METITHVRVKHIFEFEFRTQTKTNKESENLQICTSHLAKRTVMFLLVETQMLSVFILPSMVILSTYWVNVAFFCGWYQQGAQFLSP
jgi:hypothetical protein